MKFADHTKDGSDQTETTRHFQKRATLPMVKRFKKLVHGEGPSPNEDDPASPSRGVYPTPYAGYGQYDLCSHHGSHPPNGRGSALFIGARPVYSNCSSQAYGAYPDLSGADRRCMILAQLIPTTRAGSSIDPLSTFLRKGIPVTWRNVQAMTRILKRTILESPPIETLTQHANLR